MEAPLDGFLVAVSSRKCYVLSVSVANEFPETPMKATLDCLLMAVGTGIDN
jgi:hypothetical protein